MALLHGLLHLLELDLEFFNVLKADVDVLMDELHVGSHVVHCLGVDVCGLLVGKDQLVLRREGFHDVGHGGTHAVIVVLVVQVLDDLLHGHRDL